MHSYVCRKKDFLKHLNSLKIHEYSWIRFSTFALSTCVFFIVLSLTMPPGRQGILTAHAQDRTIHDSLRELQAQIQGYQLRLKESLSQVDSIYDATAILDMRKKKIVLEKVLAQTTLQDTEKNIQEYENRIREHAMHIEREHTILKQLLRAIDQQNPARVFVTLSQKSLSYFFDEVRGIELLHNTIRDTVRSVRNEQQELKQKKDQLEHRREETILLHEVQLRQELALAEEEERERALAVYTGKRADLFKKLLEQSEVVLHSLQREFFDREGVGKKLSFEKAFEKANMATKDTEVRPALLMALVAQESHFGQKQGTGTWKRDMHPSQWSSFLRIVEQIGLNPDKVPVSKKPPYGWGGAMGPAQFLPETWLGYVERIRERTGHVLPSPWDIDDAFTGVALKLAEGGASAKTPSAERKAALIYFAGNNWTNPAFSFYGDSILNLAQEIEERLKEKE